MTESSQPQPEVAENRIAAAVFRADLIVDGLVLVEIKATAELPRVAAKQVATYLRLTGLRLGLLVNFGAELLKHGFQRVANGLPDER